MTPKSRPASSTDEAFRYHYKVIAPLIMGSGVGDGLTTSCVMAQAATIDALRKGQTLDKPTDEMECACPVLRRIAIRLNDTDWWKDNTERTEVLRPLIPMLLDSKGTKKLTLDRIFMAADYAVRSLTPMRLEYIAAHSKDEKRKVAIADGIKQIKALKRIKDKKSAEAAKEVCSKLKKAASASAYAYADASASAYADAYACAYACAYADPDAYAYASAYASAYAYASASASASAYAYAYAYAQKLKYRTALLELFYKLAALREADQ